MDRLAERLGTYALLKTAEDDLQIGGESGQKGSELFFFGHK